MKPAGIDPFSTRCFEILELRRRFPPPGRPQGRALRSIRHFRCDHHRTYLPDRHSSEEGSDYAPPTTLSLQALLTGTEEAVAAPDYLADHTPSDPAGSIGESHDYDAPTTFRRSDSPLLPCVCGSAC